jgi:parallel beta-helix repeat protein
MIEQINTIAQSWWNWMWPMFWQVSVLIILIGAVDLLLQKRIWPQIRYAIWLLVLIKLILPPSLSLPTSIVSQARTQTEQISSRIINTKIPAKSTSVVLRSQENRHIEEDVGVKPFSESQVVLSNVMNGPPMRKDAGDIAGTGINIKIHWHVYVMAVWLAVVLILSSWVIVRFRKLRKSHAGTFSKTDLPQWFEALLAETVKKLKLRKSPEIALSRHISSPAVFGIFRPVLVLPADAVHRLSPRRMGHILLHELAHIKRGDLLVNTLYMLLQIIYWFNPLLWLLRRKLQHLRELCCDATVARMLRDETADYRDTILEVTQRFLTKPAGAGIGLLGMTESSSRLLVRLKWLEKGASKYRGLRVAAVFVVAGLMSACVLPMARAKSPDVLTVAASGNAMYRSIQQAIDAAGAGAVIRIGPGLYDEHVKIDKPLTLEGAGWEKTAVMTESAGADAYEEAVRTLNARMEETKSDEQRKEIAAKFGAEFKEKYGKPTLLVGDTEGVVIRDLKFTSPGKRLEGRSISVPVVEFSNAKASVSRCVVIGTPGDGIHILNGSTVEIRDSLVAAVWGTGIVVAEGQGKSSSLRLLDSELRNCHYAGIRVRGGNDSTRLERCRISGAAWHGIRYDNCSPTIIGNRIFGNARCGIYASGQTAATVKGNIFYANEMVGMSCWFRNRDTIEGNTFANNKDAGLSVLGASEPAVKNNIFFSESNAVSCGDIAGDSAFAAADGRIRLEKNLFWKNEHKAVRRTAKSADSESTPEEIAFDAAAGNVEMDPMFVNVSSNDFSLMADSPARRLDIGATEPIAVESPWPLQPEEAAIIPDGQTRDYRKWKTPAGTTSYTGNPVVSGKSEATPVNTSDIALLYHREPDVRIKAMKTLAASNNPGIIDDLIRAHSVENYTPVHNEYDRVLQTLTGNRNVRGKSAWKGWLASEAEAGRLKIEYLPVAPAANVRSEILAFALMGPDDFKEMAAALTAATYDRQKCQDAIRYMVFNDNLAQVQEFLAGNWMARLFAHQQININDVGYFLNGLANPGPLRKEIDAHVRDCLDSENPTVVANALNLIAGVEGYSTRFVVPGVEDKVVGLTSSSVPEVAFQAKRALERINPGEKKLAPSEVRKVASSKKGVLQELIDSTPEGQMLIIPKGVYTEPVTITKSLTLKGKSRNDCIFEVTANEPAIFIDTRGKGKVLIEAVTIKWQLATSDRCEYPFAVAVKDSSVEVKSCYLKPLGNFKRSPVAIYSRGFSELNINTCRFEGFEYTVCFGQGTKGGIRNSLVMDSGHQGISLYAGAMVEIVGNVVTGSKYHAVRSTGGTLNMTDNLLINNANRGVYLGNRSASGIIANNVIIGNGTGISGFARSNVKVENNIIADSSYAGIGMRDSCSLTIRYNIFQGNQRGLILFKEAAGNSNTVYTVDKNTFWGNKIDAENMVKRSSSITADPGFVDAGNGDFSLKPGPALQQKQGLTNPGVFKMLWKRWQNRADKNQPFTEISTNSKPEKTDM